MAVAEELTVPQAATRLHVSQPPLSRQIHDLEDEVGTQLFVRSQSGMRLTEAGRTFLEKARSILSQSQRAVQLAQAASRGEAGHLGIAYSVESFEPVLLRVIRLFRRLFSDGGVRSPRTGVPPASSGINPSTDRYRLRPNAIPRIGERVGVRMCAESRILGCVTARTSFSQAAAAEVVGAGE